MLPRPGYEAFDFSIPVVIRDAEEELVEPSIEPAGSADLAHPFRGSPREVGCEYGFIQSFGQCETEPISK